ncbi:hypothetical protein PVAP13_7KG033909 [Panicum virgatum]|uniref:Uncharacterized protein n=1 Tax=Panicum virgatum TaxID=38727 RepID=A0A8T0QC00_PANVG|nr:hypothetical protein PVAP13_7KG033909 [Panicum virgatum]
MARAVQLGRRQLELLGCGKWRRRGDGFPFIGELGWCGPGKELGKLLPASMLVAGVGAGLSREEKGGVRCSSRVGAGVREVGPSRGRLSGLSSAPRGRARGRGRPGERRKMGEVGDGAGGRARRRGLRAKAENASGGGSSRTRGPARRESGPGGGKGNGRLGWTARRKGEGRPGLGFKLFQIEFEFKLV